MNYLFFICFFTLGIVIGIGITWFIDFKKIKSLTQELDRVREEFYLLDGQMKYHQNLNHSLTDKILKLKKLINEIKT